MRCTFPILSYLSLTRGIDQWQALELWIACSDFERSVIRSMARFYPA